uniref:Uncharacterized protein n=1 Tax=Setaria italica TaxID=4555 RepID=K3XPA5_SETIT
MLLKRASRGVPLLIPLHCEFSQCSISYVRPFLVLRTSTSTPLEAPC